MSTAKFDTLSTLDGTKSVTTDRVTQGTAAAWVNFSGTGTVAIRASYNVASITDNGTGDYTVNFTTALVDADYSLVVTSGTATNAGATVSNAPHISAPTTTAFRFSTTAISGTHQDREYNQVAIFR